MAGRVINSMQEMLKLCTSFDEKTRSSECFNDWGRGGDTTIPPLGRSPKQPLPGIGLRDPLHGRQACPKFNSFYQGLVK